MASRIVLVEDNADDAELTRMALERNKQGEQVVHLSDGAQAIEYLLGEASEEHTRDVRLILLDLKLPKMDGMQVLQSLKSDPRTRRIPVVILTSSNLPLDIAHCYDIGVNSYVVKPVQLEEYMDKVSGVGRYWDTVNEPPAAN